LSSGYFDAIIIGAGGAGMMCAIHAARRGRKVALLDHSQRIGRKILISGGGRCNFTNIHASPSAFVSRNPHFCKSALSRFKPDDFIDMVEAHRIPYHEKKLGQLFCDDSAQQIVDLLVSECERAGAHFILGCEVLEVKKDHKFYLKTSQDDISCDSLVVATGGLSIPKIGATGFGYRIAKQFDLAVIEPLPALVGLNFGKPEIDHLSELAGVSADTIVSCNDASFRENILFTHTGLSGPAILQASLYWNPGDPIYINLLPDVDVDSWLKMLREAGEKSTLKSLLTIDLPRRLAEKFAERYLPPQPVAELSDKKIELAAEKLQSWRIVPSGSPGYVKAEVTRGGIDTDELSSKTMECKKVSGLYFIGEVVDVTGQLGGYNFQWAWASGFAAGQYV